VRENLAEQVYTFTVAYFKILQGWGHCEWIFCVQQGIAHGAFSFLAVLAKIIAEW